MQLLVLRAVQVLSVTRWPSLVLLAALCAGCATVRESSQPFEVKVVVVTMFEIGADSGDTAGEFQLWHERQKLNERLPFAHHHDLYLNRKTGVLGMVTGMGTANSATAVMALGLDPRFDLSHAYWLVAGIAGVDPVDASVGSAAWAEYLVDGDLAHEIDAREMPEGWSTGYFPLFTKEPFDPKKPKPAGEIFRLNAGLTDWAYQLTRNVDLGDDLSLQQERAHYTGYPQALKPPFVLKGDNLAGMTFWHGKLLNDWAEKWVSYWTEGKGNFVTSAMEDTGTYQALTYLHPTGKVDKDRVMVLRTASNYTLQPPGTSAAEHLLRESEGYAGLKSSVEAAYRVGSVVVDKIVAQWPEYKTQTPGK